MVKRLRHRPFTAVTRVRISLGSLWRRSQVVRHGSATPSPPVRIRSSPLMNLEGLNLQGFLLILKNSPSRTRTYDSAVNSRVLYRLSYRGILADTQLPVKPIRNKLYLQNFIQKSSNKLFGQALDRLVTVSSTRYRASTSALSTSSSSRGLTSSEWDISS